MIASGCLAASPLVAANRQALDSAKDGNLWTTNRVDRA